MVTETRCITLRVIRFKDKQSIVSALTRGMGRISFLVNDGAGKESVRRRALMMPGSVYDCVVDVRENRSLQTLREVNPVHSMFIDNPMKSTVILFICDFLNSTLRDNQPDDSLFGFVEQTISEIIASADSLGNRAICFLVGLQRFMGIEPDVAEWRPGYIFDMTGGVFRPTPPLTGRYLDPIESAAAARLGRMTSANMSRFHYKRDERRRALDLLLEYYSIHFGSVKSLKSLDVLRSLFD